MTASARTNTKSILLIEDEPADVELIRHVLHQAPAPARLQVLGSLAEALGFVDALRRHPRQERPDLIILDLNLHQERAFGVLQAIKDDEHLKAIPILVLTSSSADRDVWRSYQHHANAYIVKPTDARDFQTVLRRIVEFYLGVVLLPPATAPQDRGT